MTDHQSGLHELTEWIERVSATGWLWDVKYLSANDTYAKPNVHQGGPYVSKALLAAAFPRLWDRATGEENPDLHLPVRIDSHGDTREVRLVWYNSRLYRQQPNGRDEARMTGWGGRESPLAEPDATGSLVVFAYRVQPGRDAEECRIWIARSVSETDLLLEWAPDVEPGRGVTMSPSGRLHVAAPSGSCTLSESDLPAEWRGVFPTGAEIVEWVSRERPMHDLTIDARLMKRRECEYELFRSVEQAQVLPRLREGFPTVDDFIDFANAVLNRRKARSGRSLELQARAIFIEEKVRHSWTPRTEGKRTPDFVFPHIDRYHDAGWPADKLRMLAAKTTCKDRWRQILNEAERIKRKHLLTLQEGVSVDQYKEMQEEGVVLVVPKALIKSYPDEVQVDLVSLEQFVAEAKALG